MKLLKYLLTFLLCFSVWACGDDGDKVSAGNNSIASEVVDFKADASTQNVTVTSNISNWTATSAADWCTVIPQGKSLRISVTSNDEAAVRETTVTLNFAGEKKTFTVRQLGQDPAILIDQQIFEVAAAGGQVSFNVTANVDVAVTLPDWVTSTQSRAFTTTAHTYYVKATNSTEVRSANIEVYDATASDPTTAVKAYVAISQKGIGNYNSVGANEIPEDIKLKVASGTATSSQSGYGIEKSFDGDYDSHYHSLWNNGASDYFPITLTYNLEQAEDLSYIVYHPRKTQSNGIFKEVEIQYSEDGTTFTKLMDKNFAESNSAVRINLDNVVKAKSVRFIVKKGYGDNQGFASCAEMEFYGVNPESFVPTTLFKDETCSELKDGITEAEIQACKVTFFRNLAFHMFLNKYDKEFRVAEFKAYPHPSIRSTECKTQPFSLMDNATGISVQEGEQLVVCVGDTYGFEGLSLRVQNLDTPGADGFNTGTETYPLNKGVNKLTMRKKGLAYVMYHLPTIDAAKNAKAIKIHFASGTVNGYYDSQKPEHQGRWNELLEKATDKYFDVLGKYAHLTFPTYRFRTHTKDLDALINAYDKIVNSEMELLGLYKYDRVYLNRHYLHVIYTAYMYATAYHTAYNDDTLESLADDTKIAEHCWGPAHEIGHCNQTRPGVMWHGMTEVTTNIMSEYIQTTVFGQPSRLHTEHMGDYGNRYGKAFTEIMAGNIAFANSADVFCQLVSFWQLELYFGKVLGLTPTKQNDKGGFYPEVYEYFRTHASPSTPGEQQLDFAYVVSQVAKKDMTHFFEKWGYFKTVDKEIDDYGKRQFTITDPMITATRNKISNLGYAALTEPIEYITDGNYELFKTKPAVVQGSVTYSYTGGKDKLVFSGWQNVVAFEIFDEAGTTLISVLDPTYPNGSSGFTIPGTTAARKFTVKAVAANGTRTTATVTY